MKPASNRNEAASNVEVDGATISDIQGEGLWHNCHSLD